MRIYELKPNSKYLNEYISLRNKYIKELSTSIVDKDGTITWLSENKSKVLIGVENNSLLGSLIIHSKRDGEITIFTKSKRNGIGTKLLIYGQKLAKKEGFKKVWAWTINDNKIASSFFLKNGFLPDGEMIINSKIVGKKFVKKIL